MNLKVKVTPEESKRIQEILFRMGYGWASARGKKVAHTDMPYLLIYENKNLGYTCFPDIFNPHPYREVTPSYFDRFDTKLWKVLNE